MTKLYVASSFLNKANAAKARDFLRKQGYAVESAWIDTPNTSDVTVLREEAVRDYKDVESSDAIVVVWPGRLGTATEMGIAFGLQKPVWMVGSVPLDEFVYFNYYSVKVFPTLVDLCIFMEGWKKHNG